MRKIFHLPLIAAALMMLTAFSFENAIVPKEEIVSGGVPKDGIPAILEPNFVAAPEADFLSPDDQVIGVEIGGKTKAYPIKILTWHEVVNDTIDNEPIVVTF
ncbi:MAG: DUF3179 domain-containing protein [Desulfobacteraceae bacterium]|nr:MAG: DUF3179 domain-containing protein [Desulfobacteraceae bacterium]